MFTREEGSVFVEGLGRGELWWQTGSQELGLLERREGQRECGVWAL